MVCQYVVVGSVKWVTGGTACFGVLLESLMAVWMLFGFVEGSVFSLEPSRLTFSRLISSSVDLPQTAWL